MIIGGFLGAMIITIPVVCIILYIMENTGCYDTRNDIKIKVIGYISVVILTIGSITIGGLIGKDIDIKTYEMKIRNWKNITEVIENSMSNPNISDLEKVQLIQDIVMYNMQLEECKTEVTYWFNWYLDDSKVNKLQPISIDK